MVTIEDFKVVKLKFSEESSIHSHIFWKPHIVRDPDPRKPSGKTLFILNLPSYITEQSLKNALSKFGKIREIFFHKKPTTKVVARSQFPLLNPDDPVNGCKVGYVVFDNAKSLKTAMSFPSENTLIASSTKSPIITGIKKWYNEYNDQFVSPEDLHKEAEEIMKDYEERKEREKAMASNEPDEDGWVTVNRKKRPAPTKESNNKNGPKRKRRKKLKLENFYAFQQKETNMKHLDEKRKKFEEDGKRMMMLRKSRKFKPL
ncbi:UNVERIFIED_CONTAM: hypothetical protein RMT77_013663 [Armadillidium vulgare]